MIEKGIAQLVYSADHNVIHSTSGGAFYLIAKAFFERYPHGVIYGAAFDNEDRTVKHIPVRSMNDIDRLQGSKYVQSNLGNSFREIRKLLSENTAVLFSGTACQVRGLQNYIGEEKELLFTVDIVCHGVPSPRFFTKMIRHYESVYGGKISNFRFRNKSAYDRHGYMITFVIDGKTYKVYPEEDVYYSSFLNNKSLRYSCYSCPFADTRRVGDLSLGDSNTETFHPDEAVSLVLINTEKGKDLFSGVRADDIVKTDAASEAQTNRQLREPASLTEGRNDFYRTVWSKEYSALQPAVSPIFRLKKKIAAHVSTKTKRKIRKLFR